MIHFAGDRDLPLPVAAVYPKLSDAAWLVAGIEDAKVSEATSDRAAFKLKPKLSFISGSLDAIMDVTARVPNQTATFKVFTKAIGASSTVTATLHFSESATGGTAIHWVGELVEVTGLLKMVPKGLLQGTAEKVIEDVWTALTAKLTAAN